MAAIRIVGFLNGIVSGMESIDDFFNIFTNKFGALGFLIPLALLVILVLLLRGLYRAYRGVKACISDELTGSRVSYYMRKASGYAKAGDYAGAMSAYISAEKVRRLSPEKAHLPLKLYYAYAFGNKSRGVKPKDLLDVPGLGK